MSVKANEIEPIKAELDTINCFLIVSLISEVSFFNISTIDQYINEIVNALAKPLIKFIVKPIFSFSIAKIENIAPSI